MAQVALSSIPPKTPPPIPLRSHLRNSSTYQLKLYAIKSNTINMAGIPSHAASHASLEDIRCSLTTTQQSLLGLASRRMDNKQALEPRKDSKDFNTMSQNKKLHSSVEEGGSSELCMSKAEVNSGLPDDLQGPLHLAPLIPHLVVFHEHIQKASKDRAKIDDETVDVSKHPATQSGSCKATATVTKTGLGLTSHSLQSSQYNCETTDTKVSDWLTNGLLDSPLPEVSLPLRNSRGSDRPLASRRVPLSLFPPKSSTGDVREYMPRNGSSVRCLCPVSPLNNGRDVYGNHIPSNVDDYFPVHSQPQLLKPWPVKDDKTPLSEKLLTAGNLYDGRWKKFKSFWKTADTQVPNQQINPQFLHSISDEVTIQWDVPQVTYSGRVDNQAPHSIRSQFPAAYATLDVGPMYNMKGNCSVPDLRSHRVQHSNSNLKRSDLVDAGENSRPKNRFNVIYDHKNTSRNKKAEYIGNLPLPRRSLQVTRNDNGVSEYSTNTITVNLMRNEFSNAGRKVEQDRTIRSMEEKQGFMCEDSEIAAITPPQAKGFNKLERMPYFGIELPRKSTSSPRNPLRHDPIPASASDPKKQKQNITSHGYTALAPVSVSAISSTTGKPQPLLRTTLSKVRNISRSILTASFENKSKTSSQHQPSANSGKISLANTSMSKDGIACVRPSPANTQKEASTLAGHYQVLTAGAFDDPPPSGPVLSSSHNHGNRESLASATNEALLVADWLLQRDVRWSTDQVRSSFSSDSTSEMATQHQYEKKKKKEKRKKEDAAGPMAWLRFHE